MLHSEEGKQEVLKAIVGESGMLTPGEEDLLSVLDAESFAVDGNSPAGQAMMAVLGAMGSATLGLQPCTA